MVPPSMVISAPVPMVTPPTVTPAAVQVPASVAPVMVVVPLLAKASVVSVRVTVPPVMVTSPLPEILPAVMAEEEVRESVTTMSPVAVRPFVFVKVSTLMLLAAAASVSLAPVPRVRSPAITVPPLVSVPFTVTSPVTS